MPQGSGFWSGLRDTYALEDLPPTKKPKGEDQRTQVVPPLEEDPRLSGPLDWPDQRADTIAGMPQEQWSQLGLSPEGRIETAKVKATEALEDTPEAKEEKQARKDTKAYASGKKSDPLTTEFNYPPANPNYPSTSGVRFAEIGDEARGEYSLYGNESPSTRELGVYLSRGSDPYRFDPRLEENWTADNADRVATAMAHEAMYALENLDNPGLGFYRNDWRDALMVTAKEHPEILDRDKSENRDLLTSLVAVTSNGENPIPNYEYGIELYKNFMKTGKVEVPPPGTFQRPTAVNTGIRKIGILIDHYGGGEKGLRGAMNFLNTYQSGKDLSDVAEDIGISLSLKNGKGFHGYGSLIFGPKVGEYYAVLSGDLDRLVNDSWNSRTALRHMGFLHGIDRSAVRTKKDADGKYKINKKGEKILGQAETLLEALDKVKYGEAAAVLDVGGQPFRLGTRKYLGQNKKTKARRYSYTGLQKLKYLAEKNGTVEVRGREYTAAQIRSKIKNLRLEIRNTREHVGRDHEDPEYANNPALKNAVKKANKVPAEKYAAYLGGNQHDKAAILNDLGQAAETGEIPYGGPAFNFVTDKTVELSRDNFWYKTPLGNAAKNLRHTLLAPQDRKHFQTAGSRRFLRDIHTRATRKLKSLGYDLRVSDVQSILWHFEKYLYDIYGASTDKGKAANYLQGALLYHHPERKGKQKNERRDERRPGRGLDQSGGSDRRPIQELRPSLGRARASKERSEPELQAKDARIQKSTRPVRRGVVEYARMAYDKAKESVGENDIVFVKVDDQIHTFGDDSEIIKSVMSDGMGIKEAIGLLREAGAGVACVDASRDTIRHRYRKGMKLSEWRSDGGQRAK
jgi:hypothetical protein